MTRDTLAKMSDAQLQQALTDTATHAGMIQAEFLRRLRAGPRPANWCGTKLKWRQIESAP